MTSTSGDVMLGDVRLHWRIDGTQGAPWLVFSNSLMTHLGMWDAQVATFGDRFRILRYDTRGHGGSAVPADACTFDRLIEDVRELMDHCSVARAAVVGLSMGGVTALGLAGRHPDRVSRVAVCDCAPASSAAGAAAWDERIGVARAGGMAALVEPTVGRWFRPETLAADPPALGRVRAMIAATPLEGFIRAARALQEYDMCPALGALRAPAAFIVGAQDAALPSEMRRMAGAVPGARFTEIAQCGHLANIEQAAAFNAALADLLVG